MYRRAGEITGWSFTVADTTESDIEKAGFVNAVDQVFKAPLRGWAADPKLQELGMWTLLSLTLGWKVTRWLRWQELWR